MQNAQHNNRSNVDKDPMNDSVLDGMTQTAHEQRTRVKDRLNEGKQGIGDAISSTKENLSEAASSIASGVKEAVNVSSTTIDKGVDYGKQVLANPTVVKVTDYATSVIQKHPIQSVVGAMLLGVLLSGRSSARQSR